MSGRPEYVRCIASDNRQQSCCGRLTAEWMFVDADHARAEVRRGGRLMPCTDCERSLYLSKNGELVC